MRNLTFGKFSKSRTIIVSATAVLAISYLGVRRASACGGWYDVACNTVQTVVKAKDDTVKTVVKAGDDTAKTVVKAGDDTVKTVVKAGDDTAKTVVKAGDDTVKTVVKAGDDTAKTVVKAVSDSGHAVVKAGEDVYVAGKVIAKFVERQGHGWGDALSDAEKRVREGKYVDALWHLTTDDWKHTEENAAKATQESEIIRTVGQVAATVYGGPGGAAAYAAWYTYRQTGNAELALRAGVITGAASAAFAATGSLPSATARQIVEKTIVTGAVGGLAVAAAGGDRNAVRDGFLLSGAMVLVQTGYQAATDHPIDARASSADEPYCMSALNQACSPPQDAYLRDSDGKILIDADGNPRVDVTKTDPRISHVGKWADGGAIKDFGIDERSRTMMAVSKIPGMNAMSLFHDHLVVSWDLNTFSSVATIAPATVLTYVGTGAPYYAKLQDTAKGDADSSTGAKFQPSKAEAAAVQKDIDQAYEGVGEDVKRLNIYKLLGSRDSSSTEEAKNGLQVSVAPDIDPNRVLPEYWVALTDVGDKAPFFNFITPDVHVVKAGDVLRSNRDVNFRPGPAIWKGARPMKAGTVVLVKDVRTLTTSEGAEQKWANVILLPQN